MLESWLGHPCPHSHSKQTRAMAALRSHLVSVACCNVLMIGKEGISHCSEGSNGDLPLQRRLENVQSEQAYGCQERTISVESVRTDHVPLSSTLDSPSAHPPHIHPPSIAVGSHDKMFTPQSNVGMQATCLLVYKLCTDNSYIM